MLKKKKTIKKVVKALKKASKAHAGQAKMLKGVLNGKKKHAQILSMKSKFEFLNTIESSGFKLVEILN